MEYNCVKHGELGLKVNQLCERDMKRLQKLKAHIEFVRCCLIYNLTPTFCNFIDGNKRNHRQNKYESSIGIVFNQNIACIRKVFDH